MRARSAPSSPSLSPWLSLPLALSALLLGGCGEDFRPVIAAINPLNGATAIRSDFKPAIWLADDAEVALNEGDRHLVLYDVTGGGRQTIAGAIIIEDNRMTYEPKEGLGANRLFELVMQKETATGDKLLDVDGSEWPEEPLSWPYRARFSTAAVPRVRAVYLDAQQRRPRLYVRFSQRMDQVASNDQFRLVDQLGNALTMSRPVWVDDSSARLDIDAALDPAGLYTLEVGGAAQSADGALLDGDDDGTPGEAKDSFIARFTGSEKIIRSRLVAESPAR